MEKSVFEVLNAIDCKEHIEQKNGLNYLSWAWAWQIVKKNYPSATYEIRHWEGKPYLNDETYGIMVETSVTIEGETQTMWLFVMDGANKAMKSTPYTYQTKYGEKQVAPATMFEINTTIMRCLVKNLAMFGLGLYIYAGEDLPEVDTAREIDGLSKCKSVDELKAYWESQSDTVRKNKDFISAVNKAKANLEKINSVKQLLQ